MAELQAPAGAQSSVTAGANSLSELGPALVIAALLFNLILCFVQTRHWAYIGNPQIIASELAILITGLFVMRHRVTAVAMRITIVILVYLIGIKLINPGLELRIIHDLGIMYIFYEIGTMYSIRGRKSPALDRHGDCSGYRRF